MYADTLMGGAPSLSRPRGLTVLHDPEAVSRAAAEAVATYGGRFVGRHSVRDMLTFDASKQMDAAGNHMGKPLGYTGTRTYQVMDAGGRAVMDSRTGRPQTKTFTFDSTGAYLVGELERLDPTFHGPLVAVSWMRDIDLREDVTTADDASSFTLTTFGAAPGAGGPSTVGAGISWAGRSSTQVTSVSIDISKKVFPLIPWSMELAYTVFELESAARLGRPVDEQKFKAIQTKHQMDVDQMVYVGDTQTVSTGLINNSLMTNVNNLPNGVSGFSQWANKTPTEILQDINTALTGVWANSAWAVTPRRILIPPNQFGYISTQLISNAGSMSVLRYVDENNLLTGTGQGQLEILPMKWLIGAGVGGTLGTTGTVDRMFVYTKNRDFVRYPMTMIQRTPVQYDGLYHKATYYCKLGQMEEVYPETVGAFDGL
jgi:hypothetical protein